MFMSAISPSESIPTLFKLAPLVVFFPVLGLLLNIAFGRRMSERAVGWLASLASGLSFAVAVVLMFALIQHPEGGSVPFADWITIGELSVPWAFRVDTLSVTMMLVVGGVGTLIHIYAIGYMHEDVRHNGDPGSYPRFFIYFNLFIAAMMVLVSADNFLMLFVGWEGVGLCSYLLIGFWFDKGKDGISNALAGKKAFIVNRIGDFGLLIALFLMFWTFGSFQFDEVFAQLEQVNQTQPGLLFAMAMFMLLGVTGKSSQIPLYVWLPDAMAGPTPVSALIHAATMVTAGVYLIARSSHLFVLAPEAQTWAGLIGATTALFAGLMAMAQFDIKKVLAYSTISQLGFMVAAVGMGAFVAGIFHLVTHAFFKALLFLSAGSVIQGLEHGHHHVQHDPKLRKAKQRDQAATGHAFDPQDMRNMGGLRHRMKTTYYVFMIGGITLAGLPPLAAFWSKDEILAEAQYLSPVVYGMLVVAAFFTAFYVGRQLLMIFFGEPRTEAAAHAQENPPVMTYPLIALAGLSLFGGLLNLPGVSTLTHWLEHAVAIPHHGEFKIMVAVISTLLGLGALAISYQFYARRYREDLKLPRARRPVDPLYSVVGPFFKVMHDKFYVDELYHYIVVAPYDALSRFLAEVIDWRFWHDWFHDVLIVGGFNKLSTFLAQPVDLGVIDGTANGLARLTKAVSANLRKIETGYVRTYAMYVFLGVVVIVGYLILH
jgi:NADH-quinone oxidoreductase subunit L